MPVTRRSGSTAGILTGGGTLYEYMGPTTYAFGYSMDMVGPAYGCAAPGRYDNEQGEGGVGLGAPTF